MKPIAVFDMDDVLAHLRSHIQDALFARTGKNIPWEQWDTYDLGEIYQIPLSECLGAFNEAAILEKCLPEPSSQEAVLTAKQQGMPVHILTARGWHPAGLALTQEWLLHHGFVFDDLHVIPLHQCKAEYLRMLGLPARFFFDDSPRHIVATQNLVEFPVIVDRPWNQGLTGVHRVYNMSQAIAFMTSASPAI